MKILGWILVLIPLMFLLSLLIYASALAGAPYPVIVFCLLMGVSTFLGLTLIDRSKG